MDVVAEKIGGEVAIGEKCIQKHVETRVYLEPNRGSLQKPIEGLLVPIFRALCKGLKKNHTTVQRFSQNV